jgi:translation initiation factor 1
MIKSGRNLRPAYPADLSPRSSSGKSGGKGRISALFDYFCDMKKNDWKERLGVTYSTDAAYRYHTGDEGEKEEETIAKERQLLRISLDKRNRGGKAVTLVSGFRGTSADLEALGKWLKIKCGVGGSAKDGEIIVQGDLRAKVLEFLQKEGYTKSRII